MHGANVTRTDRTKFDVNEALNFAYRTTVGILKILSHRHVCT